MSKFIVTGRVPEVRPGNVLDTPEMIIVFNHAMRKDKR